MNVSYRFGFKEQLDQAPENIQQKFYKQIEFLKHNMRHPSLRAKKYGGAQDIWQARVDKNWRFFFEVRGDAIILLNIKKHPK